MHATPFSSPRVGASVSKCDACCCCPSEACCLMCTASCLCPRGAYDENVAAVPMFGHLRSIRTLSNKSEPLYSRQGTEQRSRCFTVQDGTICNVGLENRWQVPDTHLHKNAFRSLLLRQPRPRQGTCLSVGVHACECVQPDDEPYRIQAIIQENVSNTERCMHIAVSSRLAVHIFLAP